MKSLTAEQIIPQYQTENYKQKCKYGFRQEKEYRHSQAKAK